MTDPMTIPDDDGGVFKTTDGEQTTPPPEESPKAKKETRPGPKPGPKPIQIEVDALPAPEPSVRNPFWCGTLAGSPVQNAYVGGFDFPFFEQRLIPNPAKPGSGSRKLSEEPHYGRVHLLTAMEVERILASVKSKVVRWAGSRPMVRSMNGSKTRPYVPSENDKPLGQYLYMIELGEHRPDRSAPPDQSKALVQVR